MARQGEGRAAAPAGKPPQAPVCPRGLEAQGALDQAEDELATKERLNRSAPNLVVAQREIERLQVLVETRRAGVAAAVAAQRGVAARISDQLPAQRASAMAALAQAQAELDKTIIRAGVTGRVEQFLLQFGDIVNPFMRPAGVMVPEGGGGNRSRLVAGFGRIEAQILRPGLLAEAVCSSKPQAVIPMVVTEVQGFIAGGQVRSSDQLLDIRQFSRTGAVLAMLEPLYENGLDGVVPESACIANAYTSNHAPLSAPGTGTLRRVAPHGIDTVGLVHAILPRIQAVLPPLRTPVLSGH